MVVQPTGFQIGGRLLQDEIADALRHAIVSGQFLPGQRLIESELAELFGVSRAPLREAIQQLTADGLLNNIPRKGTFVVELSEKDVREIYSLRLALETLAVEILVDNITLEQLASLHNVITEMGQALLQRDIGSVVRLDMRLHELICHFSNHSRLYKGWSRMSDQLRSFFAAADRLYEDRQIIERHQQLVDSIASGDKEQAVATLREHITNAANRVLNTMATSQGDAGNKEVS